MKAAVLALTVVAAASTPSWFEPDQEAELVAPTAKLANTHFVAGLSAPLKPSENTIWCASGPLAWKELESFVGGPVQLTRESKTVDQLNESPFRKGQVDPSAYVAGAGVIGDGIVARLQGELEAKFGRGPDPVLARLVGGAGSGQLLTYAFLFKQIKWRVEFASLQNPISFRHSAEGTTKLAKVRSFGLKSMGTHQWCDQLARQVRIFGNSEEFAVELSNPKEDDSVILARIPPGKTLSATVQRALKLLKRKPKYLETQDTLQIPVLDFDLSHTYSDVNGGLENPGFESKALGFAIQTVRLRLDEKGAMLKSRFAALAGAPMPMKPKQLIFDRPFLILMKEKGFDPYLAIWVASPEILVPAN